MIKRRNRKLGKWSPDTADGEWSRILPPSGETVNRMNPEEQEEEAIIRQLQSGYQLLDEITDVPVPELYRLEAQLMEHGKSIRRRFIRDLTLFLATAVCVLLVMAAAFWKLPAAFAALEILAFIAPAIIIGSARRRMKQS